MIRFQSSTLEGSIITANGRNHNLINISVLCTNSSNIDFFLIVILELGSRIEFIRTTSNRVNTSYEVTLFQYHALPREIVEVELNSILYVRIQVESDRPTSSHIVSDGHSAIEFLPLVGEGNITNSVPNQIVRRILFVNLSVCFNVARIITLIAEVNLQLFARLPSLRRLNPELVVPCRRITLSSSGLTIYKEYVVIGIVRICNDCCGEWIPTILLIHVVTLLL